MRSASELVSEERDHWQQISSAMRVVRLTVPIQVAIPALALSSLSKSTRGFVVPHGRWGLALGLGLAAAAVLLALLLSLPAGLPGVVLPLWFLGTAGGAAVSSYFTPTAFVKPICVRCRLLPVIKEHEAIHLTGVSSEKAVWASMKTRHSVESLGLVGDPAICSFCPIPKRLSES